MSIKKQFETLKENWLLALIMLIVLGAVFLTDNQGINPLARLSADQQESFAQGGIAAKSYMPYQQDFAPNVQERIITKTSSLNIETKTGKFKEAESQVKSITSSTDSILLNENINSYDYGKKTYYSGSYEIKVETTKYQSILEQLKKIGEVKSFNENSNDETQQHQDLTALIETEKSRLARYQQMYKEASLVSDKIQLSDKIFDEERLIKSYEDSLNGLNNRVSYSSIYLSINEKQSDYSNIVWAKFSQLIQSLVESINSLFKLIFIILPWAFAIFIIWIIIRLIKN